MKLNVDNLIKDEDSVLTLKEAASLFKCSERYFREVLVAKRGLPVIKMGLKSFRVLKQDVEEWILKARRGLV